MEDDASRRESTFEDRRRTAVHEAGHAVVAHSLGIGITRLTIVHDPARGRKGSFALDENQLTNFRQQALVSVAGLLAEVRAFGNYHAPGARQDWEDYGSAMEWLTVAQDEKAYDALSLELKLEVRRILDTRWAAVEALAELLPKCGELTPEEVTGVIGSAFKRELR